MEVHEICKPGEVIAHADGVRSVTLFQVTALTVPIPPCVLYN